MSEASVGTVIRHLRKAKHWSIRTLAAEAHVGRQAVSEIERNASNYKRQTLEAIARALGSSAADVEAMATAGPTRPGDPLVMLTPDWMLFAQRAMRLSRLAQATLQMALLAFEDAEATSRAKPDGGLPNHAPTLTGFRHHA